MKTKIAHSLFALAIGLTCGSFITGCSPDAGSHDHGHGDHNHDHGDHGHDHGDHSHDHGDHGHEEHDHEVKAPDSASEAIELISRALAGVKGADAEGLDNAAALAETSLAAAAKYLKTDMGTASSSDEKVRLTGALDNLNIIGEKLHDAAHDGNSEKVSKIAEQLSGVLGSVKKYYPER